jgi:anti-anti-sigma factor
VAAGIDGIVESGDEAFSVTASATSGELTIVLTGEFDLGAGAHWTKVVGAFSTDGLARVTVDFGGVEFMDSSGLGLLVRLRHELEGSPTMLRLRDVPDNVRRVLDYAGVTPLFELSAS